MDIINATKQALLQQTSSLLSLEDSNSLLKTLSCQQLDEVIEINNKLQSTKKTWQEIQKSSDNIKQKYIDSLDSDAERIQAILYWNDSNLFKKISIKSIKPTLINIINNNNKDQYHLIWSMIKDKKLQLSRKEVSVLSQDFLNYLVELNKYKKPLKDMHYFLKDNKEKQIKEQDDDYLYDNENKTQMTTKEEFWVNVIANHNQPVEILNKYLVCLALDSDQRLRYAPTTKVSFTGELTHQIINYYNSLKLSPLISCRRNLTVCLNNEISQLYYFSDIFQQPNEQPNDRPNDHLQEQTDPQPSISTYIHKIALEFPHLCYVYPTKLEIDTLVNINYQETQDKTNLFVHCGNDYILSKVKPYKHNENKYSYFQQKIKTITLDIKEEDTHRPCSYINVSSLMFSNINILKDIVSIRLYGEAICL